MARPLQSTSSPSNNILLKVTVPKRTGRKRRKGTDEPFTGPDSTSDAAASGSALPRRSAEDLRRSLEDNVGRYQVETVGMVGRTHVFRGEFLSPVAVSVLVLIWCRDTGLCSVDYGESVYQSVPGSDSLV